MDELLKNQNGLTIEYLVNALNGKSNQANTLAKAIAEGLIAFEEATGEEIRLIYTNISETVSGEIAKSEDKLATRFRQEWRGDIKDGVTGEIYGTDFLKNYVESAVQQSADALTLAFESADAVQDTTFGAAFRFDAQGNLYVSKTDSPIKLRITSDRIQMIRYESQNPDIETEQPQVVTEWRYNIFRLPTAVEIPSGGSFQIGNFRFVPRSLTGNMSIVKV